MSTEGENSGPTSAGTGIIDQLAQIGQQDPEQVSRQDAKGIAFLKSVYSDRAAAHIAQSGQDSELNRLSLGASMMDNLLTRTSSDTRQDAANINIPQDDPDIKVLRDAVENVEDFFDSKQRAVTAH